MVNTTGTPRKVNAILVNIKINQPELANVYGHILAINLQNFMEIHLALVKILQKVLGLLFDSHCTRER